MIISLQEAMNRVGERQAMSGKRFCEKYTLSMLETNIKHGNGKACLFDSGDVDAVVEAIKSAQESQGKAYISGVQVSRTEFLDAILRVEKKIDRLLNAFDLPVHDS